MESIFSNLISNAIKYRHPDRTPTIDLFSYHEDGANFLLVRDNGSGIDLEKHGMNCSTSANLSMIQKMQWG